MMAAPEFTADDLADVAARQNDLGLTNLDWMPTAGVTLDALDMLFDWSWTRYHDTLERDWSNRDAITDVAATAFRLGWEAARRDDGT